MKKISRLSMGYNHGTVLELKFNSQNSLSRNGFIMFLALHYSMGWVQRGSALICGYTDYHRLLESCLADLKKKEKHMGASFEKLDKPWITMINPYNVHYGDFLAVSKIRGRWGGFETLEKCTKLICCTLAV
ncbi:hypothetical protein IFM89_012678 [Coptis chinensis]|uniref:Uncharacterized protein n=1 Tax=Coptis chinensis TaxID=261450 RepID=A0A835H3A6_9MAGN|nr:hypothetical protein IFM89_012678 [Coptis chinensis]